MTFSDFRVHDIVDEFLRERDQEPITTVAGTIFPANYYLREGATGVYQTFSEVFAKLDKHSWGTYVNAHAAPYRKGWDHDQSPRNLGQQAEETI
jgi:hypothetical protein